MKRGKLCWLRGSYTVEASFLLPFFLAVFIRGLLLGIDCYEDVCVASAKQEQLETIAPTAWIWRAQAFEKGMEWIYGNTVSEKSEK